MVAPGSQIFQKIQLAKETTHGTPVARTRRFYGVAEGALDLGDSFEFHNAENVGLRNRYRSLRPPTYLRNAPTFKLADIAGISYDDLVAPWTAGLLGGIAGVGGTADKTWTFAAPTTGSGAYESFAFDIGDDIQNWIGQYCMPTRWKISAGMNDVTKFESDWFAQQFIKGAATGAIADPAVNVKIPGDLWTVAFAANYAGIAGATTSANFLREWSFEYKTGIVPRFYQDGTLFMAQHTEDTVDGLLHLQVESTALAVSEFVDKYRAGTLDYVRMKVIGPTLGGSFYSITMSIPVYWDNPSILSGSADGVNLYEIDGHLAYDTTGTKGLQIILVCSLAAIP